jgi:hypothetical protein
MGEYGILKTIKVKVKVNEITGRTSYRTVFTNKTPTGNTEFASMFIRFVKDAANKAIEDNTYINIKDGFISFNTDSEGKVNWVLVITDFDYADNKETSNDFSEDDLPF